MSFVDIVILAVIGLSCFFGAQRGFVKEVLSLFVWAAAIIITTLFYSDVGEYLQVGQKVGDFAVSFAGQWLEKGVAGLNTKVNSIVGGVLVFIAVLICGFIITSIVHKLVTMGGLSGTDRMLGLIVGIIRGVLFALLLLALADFFSGIATSESWADSKLIPILEQIKTVFLDFFKDHEPTLTQPNI